MWHFRPLASFSNVCILGFEFSFIHSWTEDFDTPVISETCRIDMFFWYIILSNNIFMLIVFIVSEKLCINMYNKKRGNKNSMTVNERLRYDINEEWLRTGGGKIFAEQNTLDAFAKAHKVSEFEIEIFKKFLCIEPDSRHIILKKMQEIFN